MKEMSQSCQVLNEEQEKLFFVHPPTLGVCFRRRDLSKVRLNSSELYTSPPHSSQNCNKTNTFA